MLKKIILIIFIGVFLISCSSPTERKGLVEANFPECKIIKRTNEKSIDVSEYFHLKCNDGGKVVKVSASAHIITLTKTYKIIKNDGCPPCPDIECESGVTITKTSAANILCFNGYKVIKEGDDLFYLGKQSSEEHLLIKIKCSN